MTFLESIQLSYPSMWTHFEHWYHVNVFKPQTERMILKVGHENLDNKERDLLNKALSYESISVKMFAEYDFSFQFGVFYRYLSEHLTPDEYVNFTKDLQEHGVKNISFVLHQNLYFVWKKVCN